MTPCQPSQPTAATEIDIAATFERNLDIDRPALKILGTCNSHLAHQALVATAHGTAISAADPHDVITNPTLSALADKLRAALGTVDGDPAQLG